MTSESESDDCRDFSVGNDYSALARLHEAVEAFLSPHDLPGRSRFVVQLVIEEVVTNIIKYAYDDGDPHQIAIRLQLTHERVHLVIEDDGRPFDPVAESESEQRRATIEGPIEDRPIGGLGLYLVRSVVQLFRYDRRGAKNHLEIEIDRTPP